MAETVRVERRDGIAVVTIDNPPVNALDEATLEALGVAATEVAGDREVRAVILTGAGGKALAAGADLNELKEALGNRAEMEHHVGITRPVFAAWWGIEVPVIAAVDGSAAGGGLEFALACDLIVANREAKLGFPEARLGLIPGAGGTQRLPRRVGSATALQLLALGKLVDAETAQRLGLVDVVAEGPALAEAETLAAKLAAMPGKAVRGAKRAVRIAAELPLEQGLDAERELFLDLAMTADAAEGAAAFLERRPAEFRHR
ncbi:MAG TPA: enoyl-CoA hydratase/isomerase family protein [Solirubrobacterales bacterium]|nr:enoyl-CoA hydratase/isomerase family protein [Solirubrobacterales bacterium]